MQTPRLLRKLSKHELKILRLFKGVGGERWTNADDFKSRAKLARNPRQTLVSLAGRRYVLQRGVGEETEWRLTDKGLATIINEKAYVESLGKRKPRRERRRS